MNLLTDHHVDKTKRDENENTSCDQKQFEKQYVLWSYGFTD